MTAKSKLHSPDLLDMKIKMETCIKVMLSHSPIIGYILQELDRVPSYAVPTMGVGFVDKDARTALYYNPNFVKALSADALIKVILPHEIAHILNGHLGRYSKDELSQMDMRLANVGMDLSINNDQYVDVKLFDKINSEMKTYCLAERNAVKAAIEEQLSRDLGDDINIIEPEDAEEKFKDGIALMEAKNFGFEDKKSTDYYILELLKRRQKGECPKCGGSTSGDCDDAESGESESDSDGSGESESDSDGSGSGSGKPSDKQGKPGKGSGQPGKKPCTCSKCSGFDSHLFNKSKLSKVAQQGVARNAMAQGYKEWATNGKQRGNTPGGTVERVEEILFPKIPISQQFKTVIGSYIGSDYEPSSARINKRTNSYEVSGKKIKHKLKLCVIMDTSGSMNSAEFAVFRGMIKKLQQEINPEISVVCADTEVQSIEELRGQRLPVSFKGRGGTDFTPVFQYLIDKRIKPDGVIFLTDGYGALDQSVADRFRVLWVLTSSGREFDFMRGRRMKILQIGAEDMASGK